MHNVLSVLILLLVAILYGGVLLLNDYLSDKEDSSFLSPIIMPLTGVVIFFIVPINIGLNFKTHIICVLIICPPLAKAIPTPIA